MSVEIVVSSNTIAYEKEFRQLNEAWISANFWLEESDIKLLSDPQKYILDKGGNVFIALLDGKPVGTCALIVHDNITCELGKMAVDPKAQSHGIGFLLGSALLEKARQRNFIRVVLEGNTKMEASIALYRKLGFKEVALPEFEQPTDFHKRCNIFMEYSINPYAQPEYYI